MCLRNSHCPKQPIAIFFDDHFELHWESVAKIDLAWFVSTLVRSESGGGLWQDLVWQESRNSFWCRCIYGALCEEMTDKREHLSSVVVLSQLRDPPKSGSADVDMADIWTLDGWRITTLWKRTSQRRWEGLLFHLVSLILRIFLGDILFCVFVWWLGFCCLFVWFVCCFIFQENFCN